MALLALPEPEPTNRQQLLVPSIDASVASFISGQPGAAARIPETRKTDL